MSKLFSAQALLVFFVILIVTIPFGIYMLSQTLRKPTGLPPGDQQANSSTITKPKEVPKDSPVNELQDLLPSPSPKASEEPSISELPSQISGPTLNFKVLLEGRPPNNQTSKMFLGIALGTPQNNPTYLLSFSINIPASGEFQGLSLAGLDQGKTYSAYLKSPGQLATASAFTVTPTFSLLNEGQAMTLLSGDINEDNVVNSADMSLGRKSLSTTPSSEDWNSSLDFNADGVINTLDLSFINKNLNKIGLSGAWYSRSPTATMSGGLSFGDLELGSDSAKPQGSSPFQTKPTSGYWLWVPSF